MSIRFGMIKNIFTPLRLGDGVEMPGFVWTPLEDDAGNILCDEVGNELGTWEPEA